MNFELADKLSQLLLKNELDKAINQAESELISIPETEFHQIIGKNLSHPSNQLADYIEDFHYSTKKALSKRKLGFIKSIFSTRNNIEPSAYYCEMNGFTINYDRWFIDLFAYDKFDSTDWDWLSDFYDSTEKDMTITGLEELQRAFEDVHENNRFEEPYINESYEVCELLVILRLQELFRETYKEAMEGEKEWARIPMFVTAHDYELIYKAN